MGARRAAWVQPWVGRDAAGPRRGRAGTQAWRMGNLSRPENRRHPRLGALNRRTAAARRAPPGTAAAPTPLRGGARVSKARSSRPLLTCPSHSPPGDVSRAEPGAGPEEKAAGPRGAFGPAGQGAEPPPPARVSEGDTPAGWGSSAAGPPRARSCSPAGDSPPPQGRETGPAAPAESLDADFQGSRGPIQNVTLLLPAIASQTLPFLPCEIYMRQSYLNGSGNLDSLIHGQSRNA